MADQNQETITVLLHFLTASVKEMFLTILLLLLLFFSSFYFLRALQSGNNRNMVYVIAHKYVL